MLKQAIDELYSNFPYTYSLKYSGKFKAYRANIRLCNNHVTLGLSKKWKSVGKEIQIGLIQELLLKLFKRRLKPSKKNTENIELYNLFMKKIHIAAPKTKTHPLLEASFDRVNRKYFLGLLDKTNLVWGNNSVRKLGSYEYGTDTIMISSILREDLELLDYVMYHEMLHKKHKFERRNGKSYHHTSEFRQMEKKFENAELLERRLSRLSYRKKLSFSGFLKELF